MKWLLCLLGFHKWTCAAKQGVGPTRDQCHAGMTTKEYLLGFDEYSRMYCWRCHKTAPR